MLFILRHGQAEPFQRDDESRALVARGVAQVKRSADWLHAKKFTIELCYASPFLRAQQTAQLFLQQLQSNVTVQSESLLTPDSDPVLTASWIASLSDVPILLAAHMPIVALVTEQLCQQRIDFATASIAVLKRHSSGWQLHDFFTPEQ